MGVLSRIFRAPTAKADPGPAPPAVAMQGGWMVDEGWLPFAWGKFMNYWQLGYDPLPRGSSAMVEACVSAYAQTIAMCPCYHWRDLQNGGREKVTTSALSRIMREPNSYQTRSDFLLNLTRSLFLDGNAYALALRNNRFEIDELHLMNPRFSRGFMIEGEIFYSLGGNSVIDSMLAAAGYETNALRFVPARDVLHVKLHTPRDPLRGETPLNAAAMAVAASNALAANMVTFFGNQSRPSGVLQTDLTLTKPQVDELRARWDDQAKGLNAGGVPILSSGLKFSPLSVSAADAAFADAFKMTAQQIAAVFRVPLPILGIETQPTGSTEALMNFWLGNGLGFPLNQIELAFDRAFGLAADEYSELDTSILQRSNFKDRIDGLTKAVIGGLYAPNEARALEGLAAAKAGDEPRVQQQVVPLSFVDRPPPTPQPPPMPTPPTPADQGDPGDEDSEDAADAADKALTVDEVAAAIRRVQDRTDETERTRAAA